MTMTKRTFTVTRKTMIEHPEVFFPALVRTMLEERKGWPEYEVVLFDQGKELYRDFMNARSQIEASDTALEFAKTFFPDCNRIHVNPIEKAA